VHSPMNGVVTNKLVSEGETATMMPPTVVLIVQDQSTLELRFRMPEKALAEIKPGKKLRATFSALGVKRDAEVVRISSSVEPNSRTVEIFAQIPNSDGSLKPGMLADVEMLP
jgi:multidrug efflux pump subunit AcrA (membrane-fusion protein)